MKITEGHRRHSMEKLFAWLYVDNWVLNFAAKIPANINDFMPVKVFWITLLWGDKNLWTFSKSTQVTLSLEHKVCSSQVCMCVLKYQRKQRSSTEEHIYCRELSVELMIELHIEPRRHEQLSLHITKGTCGPSRWLDTAGAHDSRFSSI